MTSHCIKDRPLLGPFQGIKPNGDRGAAEFSQNEQLVFLVAFMMSRQRIKSVGAYQ
jgi:hypothetical protein